MAKEGNIVVDVGNSSIKAAKFIDDQLEERKVFTGLIELTNHFDDAEKYDWIFASVGRNYEEITALFSPFDPLLLANDTPLPITLNYHTPETLGVDRIAAAVAANALHGGEDVLVIDAGSCITYDIVDASGCYQGGVIAPGLTMRMKAMHHFTNRLPDISTEWKELALRPTGKSTRECMLTGSFSGIIHEMQGFINQYVKEYGHLVVLLTGGDARYFESNLKPHIFANSNLVLTGLNRILNYNK